jgi:uncharacterized protein YukE
MSNRVKINLTALRNFIKELENYSSDVERQLMDIQQRMCELKIYWNDKQYMLFEENLEEITAFLRPFQNHVYDSIKYLYRDYLLLSQYLDRNPGIGGSSFSYSENSNVTLISDKSTFLRILNPSIHDMEKVIAKYDTEAALVFDKYGNLKYEKYDTTNIVQLDCLSGILKTDIVSLKNRSGSIFPSIEYFEKGHIQNIACLFKYKLKELRIITKDCGIFILKPKEKAFFQIMDADKACEEYRQFYLASKIASSRKLDLMTQKYPNMSIDEKVTLSKKEFEENMLKFLSKSKYFEYTITRVL